MKLSKLSWSAFALATAVELISEWRAAKGSETAEKTADATMWVLMPTLAGALLAQTKKDDTGKRPTAVRRGLLALGFSWLGDAVPGMLPRRYKLPSKLGLFMAAQAAYLTAFWPTRHKAWAVRKPYLIVPHLASLAALSAGGAHRTGKLLGPLWAYGGFVHSMAALASGIGPRAGAGGITFAASDSLIVMREFIPERCPQPPSFWVMATYLAGQALIVSDLTRSGQTTTALQQVPAIAAEGTTPAANQLEN